jgi:hypothetical protein
MTNPGCARRPGKIQRIKAGSAQVTIYESSVRGATRFTIAFYRDGRRVRRSFDSLERATEEARLAARKIQLGLAETTDPRPQPDFADSTGVLTIFGLWGRASC